MFKWKRSHKAQGSDEKAAELESTFEKVDSSGGYGASERIELKEEPAYPQGAIELKEEQKAPLESTSTNRAQEFELRQEASTQKLESTFEHAATLCDLAQDSLDKPTTESSDSSPKAKSLEKVDSSFETMDCHANASAFDRNDSKLDSSVDCHAVQAMLPMTAQDAASEKVDSREKHILLFDLDGTLLDSIDGIYHSFIHACGAAFSPTRDEVRSLIGLPLAEMFIAVGFEPKEAQDRAIAYKNHYRKIYLQETKLLPNVIESLIMASGFAHLGVVTTKTALYSKHILQHFDILKFFQVVVGSEDVEHPKPHPEPILKALCSLPIAPKEQVFMIGDTIYDLEAAHNAQINSVWVRSGYGVGLESSANASFDNVYDAVKALRAQAKEYDDNWHSL